MSEYRDFSSLPPEEERHFAIYEERSQVAASQSTKLGIIVAASVAAAWILFAIATFSGYQDRLEEGAGDREGAAQAAESQEELGEE